MQMQHNFENQRSLTSVNTSTTQPCLCNYDQQPPGHHLQSEARIDLLSPSSNSRLYSDSSPSPGDQIPGHHLQTETNFELLSPSNTSRIYQTPSQPPGNHERHGVSRRHGHHLQRSQSNELTTSGHYITSTQSRGRRSVGHHLQEGYASTSQGGGGGGGYHTQMHHQQIRHYNTTPSTSGVNNSSSSRMTAQWYTQPSAANFFVSDTPASNSREMRNRAEKLRRDKLNSYISELATLVPMVSGSAKRMDKTSILRLTATHLRIYHTLLNGNDSRAEFNSVDPMALEQLIYDQLEGFLLILTPTGKIVFVSHTVEQLLGHLQTDLMGQSIYTITSSDDHDKLRLHLSLDMIDVEWRRYFNVSLAKSGPRTEAPTYEQFNVMGMIRPAQESKSKVSKEVAQTSKINNNVLVFFVKLYRPPALSDMLIEANKDEYITRHLIDGRIVNCDHRISFVAGYMIEEISGLSAFKFMHREDVRWTMIALRQMYDRGESVGWSCYRLLSRTGQFIYLRTFGYLEVDNQGVVESFVCVNTLVTEEEGKRLIKEMKERYSVLINASAPTPQITSTDNMSIQSVEDPRTLEECIKYLITNHLPTSPKTDLSSPNSIENKDCYMTELPLEPPLPLEQPKKKRTNDVEETTTIRKRSKRRTISSESVSSTEMLEGFEIKETNGGSTQGGCRPDAADKMHKDQRSVYQSQNLLSRNLSM